MNSYLLMYKDYQKKCPLIFNFVVVSIQEARIPQHFKTRKASFVLNIWDIWSLALKLVDPSERLGEHFRASEKNGSHC